MRRLLPVLAILILLGACRRDEGEAGPHEHAAVPAAAGAVYERRWQAVLPCADCAGIDTELLLIQQGERREYVLTESYLGVEDDGDTVFHSQGAWAVSHGFDADPQAVVYTLDADDATRRRAFLRRDDDGLELLDRSGRRIDSRLDYTLRPVVNER
ncbi:copper resistance protein NlpE N-terminal domain-containing protein [Rehaibacterium terrae]|jgi:copper homeostasis protein (lipoprotein)|uniref:Copper homeostasis protein (Lipoprotein) n=1 Tax=Rehaibacterium terrae TaxID=1341696 RepID=A0A7W7XZL6_9GAMM|nr:copper resistance protein NlpE N-terminal domain-containing protein [Rehaibacterium terrae]MBB5015374.1 copper homeostasis protein (lipoprotein) [Rehaibacterium terrae]